MPYPPVRQSLCFPMARRGHSPAGGALGSFLPFLFRAPSHTGLMAAARPVSTSGEALRDGWALLRTLSGKTQDRALQDSLPLLCLLHA